MNGTTPYSPRMTMLNFRVSEMEKRAIQAWAARGTQTVSDAVRAIIFKAVGEKG